MTRRVKRAQPGVRKVARRQGTRATVNRARRSTGSAWGGVLAVLPFTEEQIGKFFLVLILCGAAALAWFVASLAGLPQLAHQRYAALAADAGYEVARVEVRGVERMNELSVYERVLGEKDRAMPLVELDAVREQLVDLPWVRDARVSRQLPDTLVVDILERQPHAVLAKPDRLVLIDREGIELEPISVSDARAYLRIEGPGAQRQVAELDTLLDAAPALKSQVARAEWVGNRRWNLFFKSDQQLALPEGGEASKTALVSFAQADGVHRLIGGEVLSFDMRNAPRMYMRVPGREGVTELGAQ